MEQSTPIKKKNPKRKLKITEDPDSDPESRERKGRQNPSISSFESSFHSEIESKYKVEYPWLSINYFVDEAVLEKMEEAEMQTD